MSHNNETKHYIQAIIHGTRNKLVAINGSLKQFRDSGDETKLDRAQEAVAALFDFMNELAAELRKTSGGSNDDDAGGGHEAIDSTPSES
jgi:hypothetical protein